MSQQENQDGSALEERKRQEREFHNVREEARKADEAEHDAFYTNRRFYSIAGRSRNYLDGWLQDNCPGAEVLDYCCGTGEMAIRAARLGARVTGIDISDVSIESAAEAARAEGLEDRCTFIAGDAEATGFPDNSFDVIIATGVLHHVDLDAAYKEMSRILRPGGKAVCVEAMNHNPIIMWYRRRTPHLRTAYEVDHILGVDDIRKASDYFGSISSRFFHLAGIAAIPLLGTPLFKPALGVFNLADDVLLRIPFIRRQAWQAIFTLENTVTPPR